MFTSAKVRTKVGEMTQGLPRITREHLPTLLLGSLVVPATLAARDPINAAPVHIVACLGLALAGWLVGSRIHSRITSLAGALLLGALACLVTTVSYPGGVEVIAPVFGLAVGLLAGLPKRSVLVIAAVSAAGLALVTWYSAVAGASLGVALGLAAIPAGWRLAARPSVAAGTSVSAAFAVSALAIGAFSIFWIGSTAPSARWLGPLTSHGPRDQNMVALTFDDGPNPESTLQVAAILDSHGVKGTFFEVGKAVDERPDITNALLDDGQVIGNHSYLHDAVRYLDPRYPELARAERVFIDKAGVCPALFRPPHGTHTPFMSYIVRDHGMQLVTWDVSAQDWVEHDAQRLAENILAKVKPGSIILLHDGLDGNIPADRSVVVAALPAILDGLAARGLTPVTLDKLLNVPAYLTSEQCTRFRLSSEAAVSLRPDVVESQARRRGP
ncbi:MAG: polysaccharide deacetylase family protein [bacterium]